MRTQVSRNRGQNDDDQYRPPCVSTNDRHCTACDSSWTRSALVRSQGHLDYVARLQLRILICRDTRVAFLSLSNERNVGPEFIGAPDRQPRRRVLQLLARALQFCLNLTKHHTGVLQLLKQFDPPLVIDPLKLSCD